MALLRKLAGHKVHYVDYDIQSIIDNLNNILKCTRDYGSFLQSFGISDYRYLSTREEIAKSIIRLLPGKRGRSTCAGVK